MIDKLIEDSATEDFPLYESNWEIFHFFMRLQTQWIVGGMGHKIGLNYPGVESAARLLRYKLNSDLFQEIQLMELAALKEMNSNV